MTKSLLLLFVILSMHCFIKSHMLIISEHPDRESYLTHLKQQRAIEARRVGILLLKAVKENNLDAVKKLINNDSDLNVDVNLVDPQIRIPDYYAIFLEMKNAFKDDSTLFLDGDRAIHYACKNNNNEIVKILLSASAEVNVYSYSKFTPLHIAAKIKNVTILSDLLKAKADVNACTNANATPLTLAATSKDFESVKLLLDSKADPNIQNKPLAFTPLHIATSFRCDKIVDLLLQSGAKIHLKNLEKLTAAQMSQESRHKNIIEIFEKHYAKLIFEKINKLNLLPKPLEFIIAQYAVDFEMSTEPQFEEAEISYLEMFMRMLESV